MNINIQKPDKLKPIYWIMFVFTFSKGFWSHPDRYKKISCPSTRFLNFCGPHIVISRVRICMHFYFIFLRVCSFIAVRNVEMSTICLQRMHRKNCIVNINACFRNNRIFENVCIFMQILL